MELARQTADVQYEYSMALGRFMLEKKRIHASGTSITSLDVARRAGVSRTTVSYVLNENGNRNGHVSDATRSKVLQAAQELGYSIHRSARALRRGQSDEICVIVDLPLTIHRTELVVSVQQHAFHHGYPSVVYFSHGLSPEQLNKLLLEIFARRPIGIFATARSITAENIALAKSMKIHNILLYSVKPIPYARTIILPTMPAGYLAARHLLVRGHRRLALLHPADPLHEYGYLQRLEGMQAAIAEFPGATLAILPLQFALSDAHRVVDMYLTQANHPTGIYAYNDEYALLLMGALFDRGVLVPRDIAVVGTDDISLGELVRPALTTIRFDEISLGERAVEMLLTEYRGQPLAREFSQPLMPQLVRRGSA
jgi:LacI family transcriptional regulator